MEREKRFNQIVRDIKNLKIQGAKNVAEKALFAYKLIPTKKSRKKLLSIRPTEPLLRNVLKKAEKEPYEKIKNHFQIAQNEINKNLFRLIKNGEIVYTHCHSSNVVNALMYSKKKGKKFQVYNTETRPVFQGIKTARELRKAGIKVTLFVDSAIGVALSREQGTKKVSKVFLGADALLKGGIINKIGSEVIAQVAKNKKIPVYIIADSWKFSNEKINLEERPFSEVWKRYPKLLKIKIRNPAFEFVDKKYITGIITELGIMKYGEFIKKVQVR